MMLLAEVAANKYRIVVCAHSVLHDLVCRRAETCQWIRTSALTLNALARYVAAPLLFVATQENHTAYKELGAWGTMGTMLEWLLLLLEDDREFIFCAVSVPVNLLDKCDT